MNFIETIRQWLAGKKTYLLAVAALIGTAVAWGEGTITNIEAIVAAYVELTTIFIRAGIAKAPTATDIVNVVESVDETDAYNEKQRAGARLVRAQARNVEFQNILNDKKLQAAQKQAEVVQIVEQVVDKKLSEDAKAYTDAKTPD